MKRAPQKRRFKGYHLPDSQLLTFVQHEGVTWCVYEGSPGPGTLMNIKLAADGTVYGKANYWLLWNGSRIVNRVHGRMLREQRPALCEALEQKLREGEVRQQSMSVVSRSACRESAGASWCDNSQSPVGRLVVATMKPDAGTLDDGSDLI